MIRQNKMPYYIYKKSRDLMAKISLFSLNYKFCNTKRILNLFILPIENIFIFWKRKIQP